MPVAEDREYLSLTEAAERFGVTVKRLEYWLTTKQLARYRRGDRRVYVDAAETRELVERKNEIRRVD